MAGGAAADCRHGVRRRVRAHGRGRLRHGVEPRAADGRRGAVPGRTERGRLRARGVRAAPHPQRAAGDCGSGHCHGAHRRARRPRCLHRGEGVMSTGYLYEPLPDIDAGLRLHLNENTGGCSPAVLEAIARLTREDIAAYPVYTSAARACAAALGVSPDEVLLTNGLDEGILTVALALLPRHHAVDALVVEPAYGMFGPSAR